MKKTLVALAALAATGAYAQSSVTIYGALDASIVNATKINGAYTNNAATAIAAGTQNVTAFTSGAIVSPVWGIRGSEDLGKGMSAIFNVEGDIAMNNGTTNGSGMWRRKAIVGLSDKGMGTIKFGLELNPIIELNGGLMPVSGNSVSTVTSSGFGYADFFTKNAITYVSPALFGGLVATFQKGLSNTIDEATAGSMTAWGLKYSAGPLTLTAAGQSRTGIVGANTITASNTLGGGGTAVTTNQQASAAHTNYADKKANILGASYALGQWTLGAARINSTISKTGISGLANIANGAVLNAGDYSGTQLGFGYQMNQQTLLGASHTRASSGATLMNTQARYDFSKRTTGYVMYGLADNSSASQGNVIFAPFAPDTNTTSAAISAASNAANSATNNLALTAVAGVKQSAIMVGMFHRF